VVSERVEPAALGGVGWSTQMLHAACVWLVRFASLCWPMQEQVTCGFQDRQASRLLINHTSTQLDCPCLA
jgi:hypothetical protein